MVHTVNSVFSQLKCLCYLLTNMGSIKVLTVFCCLILFSSTCAVCINADNYEMQPPESNEEEIFSLSPSPSTDDGILMTTGNLDNPRLLDTTPEEEGTTPEEEGTTPEEEATTPEEEGTTPEELFALLTTPEEEFASLATPEKEFAPLTTPEEVFALLTTPEVEFTSLATPEDYFTPPTTPDNKFTPSVPFNWTSEIFSSTPPSHDLNSLLVTDKAQTTKSYFITYRIQGNVTCKCGERVSETILKMQASEDLFIKIRDLMLLLVERVEHLPRLPDYAVEDCKLKQECEFLYYLCHEFCYAGEWFCCKNKTIDFTIHEKSPQKSELSNGTSPSDTIDDYTDTTDPMPVILLSLHDDKKKNNDHTVVNVTCRCGLRSVTTTLETEEAEKLYEKIINESSNPAVSGVMLPNHIDYRLKGCLQKQECELVYVICRKLCFSTYGSTCCNEGKWKVSPNRRDDERRLALSTHRNSNQKSGLLKRLFGNSGTFVSNVLIPLGGESEAKRRPLRSLPQTCRVPTRLQTSSINCTLKPSSIKCVQRCLFGHAIESSGISAISVEKTCRFKENIWFPSAFGECKPFVDCNIGLQSPSKLECTGPTLTKGPICRVRCYAYENRNATSWSYHNCDIEGKWTTDKFPYCATSNTGLALIKKPEIFRHN